MEWIPYLARKTVALAILVWLIYAFRKAARRHGRSVIGWSAVGVTAFYSTYFLVSIGLVLLYVGAARSTGDGLSIAERRLMPAVVATGLGAGVAAAFGVAAWLLRRLARGSVARGGSFQQGTDPPSAGDAQC